MARLVRTRGWTGRWTWEEQRPVNPDADGGLEPKGSGSSAVRSRKRFELVRRLPRRVAAPVTAVTLCWTLGLGAVPALGDPGSGSGGAGGSRAYPSQDQVDRARAQARRKAQDVGAIKAQLLLANQRLEQAAT